MTKIAFVTPWFGDDIPGGSETQAKTTAGHLQQTGMDVEILTTCIRDQYADWGQNHHAPGAVDSNGVLVRRFPVEKRKAKAFDRLNRHLLRGKSLTRRQERTFIREMFVAPSLYQYIQEQRENYLFFFIPYMFASTYYGVLAAPDRALVIPCLHDEAYARMHIYRDMLSSARGLLFNTEAEAALAESLVGPVDGQMRRVMGEGIETAVKGDGQRFRDTYDLDGAIVLYAGRRDEGKNVPLLTEYWNRYLEESSRRATLVFIGPRVPSAPGADGPFVRDLGFLPARDKYDAFAAADVLCQPSVHESFALVVMESWVQDTPVLVHGDCAVTHQHVTRSGGGLAFTDYDEFAAALTHLFDAPEDARRKGQLGRRYVLDNYQWSAVVARYQDVIAEANATR